MIQDPSTVAYLICDSLRGGIHLGQAASPPQGYHIETAIHTYVQINITNYLTCKHANSTKKGPRLWLADSAPGFSCFRWQCTTMQPACLYLNVNADTEAVLNFMHPVLHHFFHKFFGEFSQILVWALCKRAWKQAACLSDLGDLGLCLKLLFWKDQGRDWFDIKRTAESGTLLNTQWAKHLYCIHTQHKINYTCAVAESNTIKILAGPCFVEKRQTCIFNVAAAVQVSKKNWIFNLENNLVWLYFCMYCMYFVCHTVSNLTSRAIVFLSKTKPFSIFQKYFIWYWSRYKEIKEHGFILQDVGMKL